MPRHIRHFRAVGLHTEPLIQFLADLQAFLKQLRGHKFRMGGKGQSVPADEPVPNGLLQSSVIPLERFPDEPAAHRPNKRRIRALELPGSGNGIRDVLGQILFFHVFRVIGKADIQMGLENEVHFFDAHKMPSRFFFSIGRKKPNCKEKNNSLPNIRFLTIQISVYRSV